MNNVLSAEQGQDIVNVDIDHEISSATTLGLYLLLISLIVMDVFRDKKVLCHFHIELGDCGVLNLV